MQAQALQLAPQPQLRLPLTKFSSATTSRGYGGPIPWSHLTDEDTLFATFECPSPGDVLAGVSHTYRFQVLNEPEVLVLSQVEQDYA